MRKGSRRTTREDGVAAATAMLRLGLLGGIATAVVGVSTLAGAARTSQPITTVDAGGARHAQAPAVAPRQVTAKFKAATELSVTGAPPAYFSDPITLPHSDNIGEPSMLPDNNGTIYIAGPGSIGSGLQTVFLWKSTDGGHTFTGPLRTNTLAGQDSPIGGGDADIAIDKANDIFIADLWLGNSAMEVSSDGGTTWTANPWGHLQPLDDRPWLTYDAKADALWGIWDGVDGIHVGKATLRSVVADARASAIFVQDVVAIPEQAAPPVGVLQGTSVRNCVCPTGNIVVDPKGTLWFAFSRQSGPNLGGGVGIASSSDGGLTWTQTSIAGSGNGSPPTQVGLNFPLMRGDEKGNLYVTWAEPVTSSGQSQLPQVFYSYLRAGDTAWHHPVQVSNASGGALMPTIAVVSPGVVDVAYYNGTVSAVAAGAANWDIDIAQTKDAASGAHFIRQVAYPGVYVGQSLPRFPGFGDFFSMVVDNTGMASIVSDTLVAQNLFQLIFIHQTAPLDQAVVFNLGSASGECPPGLTGTPPRCVYNPTCPPGTVGGFPFCAVPQSGTAPGGSSAGTGEATGRQPTYYAPIPGAGGTAPNNATQAGSVDALTTAQRAALSKVAPPSERTGASGGLALLVAGGLAILLCGVALVARARH